MPTAFTGIRFASGALMALALLAFPRGRPYLSFVWSFAFCHYLMALWYSRPPIRAALGNRAGWPWLAVLAGVGTASYLAGVELSLYFGIHHALNEAFMLDRVTRQRSDPRVRLVRGAGFVFHMTAFFCLTGTTTTLLFEPWWLWSLPVAGGLYAWTLLRARPVLSRREMADHLLFEAALVPLAVAVVASGTTLNVYDVSLYHFLFWTLFPARSMWQRGTSMAPYWAATVLLLGGFFVFSPIAIVDPHFGRAEFRHAFTLLSFVHITMSVAISNANPDVVNQLFRPAAGSAALVPAPLGVQGAGR